MIQEEFGKVENIKKTFASELKKRYRKIIFWTIFSVVWTGLGLYFFAETLLDSSLGFFVLISPWIGLWTWLASLHMRVREAFWVQLASKYNWIYDLRKNFKQEKALVFQRGHSKNLVNGISGILNDHPFHIFEYEYSIGEGKGKQTFVLTIFEVKFKGGFPHLYLDYKSNSYSTKQDIGGTALAKLPLPKEFEDVFKFYSPKKYEIETLEIFTPDVFAHLLDAGWNHDMEFVDGELVIYRKIRLNSFVELEEELDKIKKFVDILSPQLNRLRLTTIGDISHSLSEK